MPLLGDNVYMSLRVDAVYENGVLKPLQPLDLSENEQVALTIDRESASYEPDYAYVQSLRDSLRDAAPAPGLDEVRRRLAKIPGSMAEDFIADREDS
jgi:predicted DNA-binding antitoxin AbrB/MazE fold protein